MLESQLLQSIFRDASDLVVILQPNRSIKSANPAFLEVVPGARLDVDFMSLVSPDVHDEVLGRLVRAAGGDDVGIEVRHGKLTLNELVVGQVAGTAASHAVVAVGGKGIPVILLTQEGRFVVRFPIGLSLEAGQRMEVSFVK